MAIAASLGVFLSNRYGFAVLFLSCVGLSLCSLFFSLVIKGREVIGRASRCPLAARVLSISK